MKIIFNNYGKKEIREIETIENIIEIMNNESIVIDPPLVTSNSKYKITFYSDIMMKKD
jgi:hypothetical protein